MPPMPDRTALIRPVPANFDRALVREGRPRIDVGLARAQHDEYRRQLEMAGHTIEVVPADEAQPDCVFIEDTAVIVGKVAVITRPGAVSRRAETSAVARALATWFPTTEITEPGTLDGGDVFRLGNVLYVGRSARTNSDGIDQLRAIAFHQGLGLVTVGVRQVLHLKSAVLPIDEETVVVTPRTVDEDRLDGIHIIYEDDAERHRFSALPLGEGRLLVTASAPATVETVAKTGHEVVVIDVSQIQAADGGLTCMSILF
jgi:dimethylargininase